MGKPELSVYLATKVVMNNGTCNQINQYDHVRLYNDLPCNIFTDHEVESEELHDW